MPFLVHCVTRNPPVVPADVASKAFPEFITDGTLCAAVSEIAEIKNLPPVQELLDFEKTVESLFLLQTVIPMRYGCIVHTRNEVIDILHTRAESWSGLLARLDGCAEMGLRILFPPQPAPKPLSSIKDTTAPQDGAGYLARQRERYRVQDRSQALAAQAADLATHSLSGLVIEQRMECRETPTATIVSLQFLLSRNSIEPFRDTIRLAFPSTEYKLLLSGPWPPYSFVVSAQGQAGDAASATIPTTSHPGEPRVRPI